MSVTPRKTIRYWLKQLRDTKNDYITITDDSWEKHEGWAVSIGDHRTWDDYWRDQPLGYGFHEDLSKAIQLALKDYENSKLQRLVNELK